MEGLVESIWRQVVMVVAITKINKHAGKVCQRKSMQSENRGLGNVCESRVDAKDG